MDRHADLSHAARMFEYCIAAIIEALVQIQCLTKTPFHLSILVIFFLALLFL